MDGEDDYTDGVEALENDFSKMQRKGKTRPLAIKDDDDDSDGAIEIDILKGGRGRGRGRRGRSGKAKAKGRGKGQTLEEKFKEMRLTPKEQKKANLLVLKGAWQRGAKHTMSALIKEVENAADHHTTIQKAIDSGVIGAKLAKEWKKDFKSIKSVKDTFKPIEKSGGIDGNKEPEWFSMPAQKKSLETAKSGLAQYRKTKDNCLKCVNMVK